MRFRRQFLRIIRHRLDKAEFLHLFHCSNTLLFDNFFFSLYKIYKIALEVKTQYKQQVCEEGKPQQTSIESRIL